MPCSRTRILSSSFTFALAIIGATIMTDSSDAQSGAKPVVTSSGLQMIDTTAGTGASRPSRGASQARTGWGAAAEVVAWIACTSVVMPHRTTSETRDRKTIQRSAAATAAPIARPAATTSAGFIPTSLRRLRSTRRS